MANEELTLSEVKRMAEGVGLTRLTEEHLQQLLRATIASQERSKILPVGGLTPADEPSHVYRPTGGN